jgi:hypothetical protein
LHGSSLRPPLASVRPWARSSAALLGGLNECKSHEIFVCSRSRQEAAPSRDAP